MSGILTEIITILVGGINGIAEGVGAGLNTLAESIFLTTDATAGTTSLSVFGALVVVFAGIGLAIGLCRLVVRWISTLGGRKV